MVHHELINKIDDLIDHMDRKVPLENIICMIQDIVPTYEPNNVDKSTDRIYNETRISKGA